MRLHGDYDPLRSPRLIVVVSAATAVATTVQKFIIVLMQVTHDIYDCTEIYRRSHSLLWYTMTVQEFIVMQMSRVRSLFL